MCVDTYQIHSKSPLCHLSDPVTLTADLSVKNGVASYTSNRK